MIIYDINMNDKKNDFKFGNDIFEIKSFSLLEEQEILISLKKIGRNRLTKEQITK